MSDDIDLFRTCFSKHLHDSIAQFRTAVADRFSGLLSAVVDSGSVAYERCGNASPVVDKLPVAEEYSVNHDDRVLGFAYLTYCAALFKFRPAQFKDIFPPCGFVEFPQNEQIYYRNIP